MLLDKAASIQNNCTHPRGRTLSFTIWGSMIAVPRGGEHAEGPGAFRMGSRTCWLIANPAGPLLLDQRGFYVPSIRKSQPSISSCKPVHCPSASRDIIVVWLDHGGRAPSDALPTLICGRMPDGGRSTPKSCNFFAQSFGQRFRYFVRDRGRATIKAFGICHCETGYPFGFNPPGE